MLTNTRREVIVREWRDAKTPHGRRIVPSSARVPDTGILRLKLCMDSPAELSILERLN